MTDRARSLGLHPGAGHVCASRPEITAYHVTFAQAKRAANVSWQNIGRMLGVNVDSLRRAVEAADTLTAPPPPGASLSVKVLRLIAGGTVGTGRVLSPLLNLDTHDLSIILGRLKERGLLRQDEARGPYELTAKGIVEAGHG